MFFCREKKLVLIIGEECPARGVLPPRVRDWQISSPAFGIKTNYELRRNDSQGQQRKYSYGENCLKTSHKTQLSPTSGSDRSLDPPDLLSSSESLKSSTSIWPSVYFPPERGEFNVEIVKILRSHKWTARLCWKTRC